MGDSIIIDAVMGWLKHVTVWDLVIGLVVIAAVGGFINKKLWPWLVSTATSLVQLAQMVAAVQGLAAFIKRTDATLDEQNLTLTAQDAAIKSIHHETHTNNGSSIKDSVNRQERSMNTIVLPKLDQLSADIEAFRKAEVTTTVEVVTTKDTGALTH